jgi:hypothetical protein
MPGRRTLARLHAAGHAAGDRAPAAVSSRLGSLRLTRVWWRLSGWRQPRPPGYRAELEGEVELADGRRAWIRPIVPADAPALRTAIETADDRTIRDRFLGGRPILTDAVLHRLTRVDYDRRLALVAFGPDGTGTGLARYEGRAGRDDAEVAVVVAPGWRHVGSRRRCCASWPRQRSAGASAG